MDTFTQQLKSLTLNVNNNDTKKLKSTLGYGFNNNPPYYDPSKNHVHKWKNAKKINGIKHRQFANEKYITNKEPVNLKYTYCSICHEKKIKPFVVDSGSGEMCGLVMSELIVDKIKLIRPKTYNTYSLEDKYNEVFERLQQDPHNENLQIHCKDLENMLNWVEKVTDPQLYQLSYLHLSTNIDYMNAVNECLKYNDYQNAVTYLWVSYTITRDNNALIQIQSMINGYKQVFGHDLHDYIKEHNDKMKLLVGEITPPVLIKNTNKRTYSETRPKYYWKKHHVDFSKRQHFHGLRPFPKIDINYVKVK